MWTIFKVFIEFVIILLLFYVLVFLAPRHVGSQLPDQGSNPRPPALEGAVLTTGLPGKSQEEILMSPISCIFSSRRALKSLTEMSDPRDYQEPFSEMCASLHTFPS